LDEHQPVSSSEASAHKTVRLILRFAPAVVLIAALIALVLSGALKHLSLGELQRSRHDLEGYVRAHPVLSVLVYVAVYIAAITLSLPAALVLTVTGGFLFGPWLGGVSACLGASLGATVVFLISRLTVGDALEKGVSPRVKALEEGIKKDAFFYLLTLRLIPVTPFWLVNVAAGLLSIRLSTYVTATVIGIFPASLIYAGIGSGLGKLFDRGVQPHLHNLITPELALPLVALAVLSVLPILYHQYRGRQAAKAASVADPASVQ